VAEEIGDVRTEVRGVRARTLGDDLRAAAARDPDRVAVITPSRRLSYGELDRLADGVAAGLYELGVRRGDRVVIVLPNGLDAALGIYGALRAGAVFSPVNPTIKHEKLGVVLANSGAVAVFCDDDRAQTVMSARERAGEIRIVTDVAEFAESAAGPAPRPPLSVDLAAVIYTSGSTGDPKGVTLTHANMTFAADSIIEYLEMGGEDVVLCGLPLSFDYGLYQLLMSIRVGGTLVLEPGFALPGRIVKLLEDEAVTGLPCVPTISELLLSLPGIDEREFPTLRFLTNTAAALSQSAVERIGRTFPNARLYSMYGLTECKRTTYLPPDQLAERPTSVGVAIPGTEVWIEDGDGNRLGPGEVGELMIRGAHVMHGYWGDPEATAACLRPGRWPWERVLASGDLFRADEEGYLYFVGRGDDLIKSGGQKVVPREIEDTLLAVHGVREAAVVGVPDRLLGQAVHAHVSLASGSALDAEALRARCATQLEAHLIPRRVVIHEQLPRTSNGKIDRAALAAR
jgi:long-chain acyl-CoA synthetase